MSDLFNTASRIVQDAVDSPLTVMRKLGFYIPSKSDISTGVTEIAEGFSRGSDAKEMTTGSQEFSEGNYLSGGTKMLGGLAGMAIPFSNKIRSAGKAVGKNIDDQLLNMKYTRETPKTKGGFSSVDLAAQGKITDKEAIGGMFNPISFGKDGMKVGKDASNLNTSRIEISTFDPASTPSSLGFGMKTADDIGLPASQVGTKTKDAIKVQTNLIEGSKWKWEGKVPEGFENNTHLVSMQGGSKLKKASGGPTDHSYATKVIYEKGGNLSTYDTRAEYVKELYKSVPESMAALKIKMPKEVKKVTKELKAEGKSTEEIKKKVDSLKKKLNRDYKGDNPKGKPTTVGVPEFGKKIGDIKKGGIIQPVYDQIIMREAGGQVLPMQYGGGLDDAYMNRSSAFAAPDANSAFDRPIDRMPMPSSGGLDNAYMSLSQRRNALPMMSREQGGGLKSIPRERMIGDQPHQLSYINEEEAGLLKALGGSGRKVDGIPAYDADAADAAEGAGGQDDADDAAGLGNSTGGPEGGSGPDESYFGSDQSPEGQAAAAAAAAAANDAASQAQDDATWAAMRGEYKGLTDPNQNVWGMMGNPSNVQGPGESNQDFIDRVAGKERSVFMTAYRGKYGDWATANAAYAAALGRGAGPSLSSGYSDGYTGGGPMGTADNFNDQYMSEISEKFQNILDQDPEIAQANKDQKDVDLGMTKGNLMSMSSQEKNAYSQYTGKSFDEMYDQAPASRSDMAAEYASSAAQENNFGQGLSSSLSKGLAALASKAKNYMTQKGKELTVTTEALLKAEADRRGGTYSAMSQAERYAAMIGNEMLPGLVSLFRSGVQTLDKSAPMGSFTDQFGETFDVDESGNLSSRGAKGFDGNTAPPIGPPTIFSPAAPEEPTEQENLTSLVSLLAAKAKVTSDPETPSPDSSSGSQSPATTMGSTQSPSSIPGSSQSPSSISGSSQDPDLNYGGGEGEEKPRISGLANQVYDLALPTNTYASTNTSTNKLASIAKKIQDTEAKERNPSVQIVMDVYGITEEEAEAFLGTVTV